MSDVAKAALRLLKWERRDLNNKSKFYLKSPKSKKKRIIRSTEGNSSQANLLFAPSIIFLSRPLASSTPIMRLFHLSCPYTSLPLCHCTLHLPAPPRRISKPSSKSPSSLRQALLQDLYTSLSPSPTTTTSSSLPLSLTRPLFHKAFHSVPSKQSPLPLVLSSHTTLLDQTLTLSTLHATTLRAKAHALHQQLTKLQEATPRETDAQPSLPNDPNFPRVNSSKAPLSSPSDLDEQEEDSAAESCENTSQLPQPPPPSPPPPLPPSSPTLPPSSSRRRPPRRSKSRSTSTRYRR